MAEVGDVVEEFKKLSPLGKTAVIGGGVIAVIIGVAVYRARAAAASGAASGAATQQQAAAENLANQGNSVYPSTFDINQLASAVAAVLEGTGSVITGPPGPAGPPGASGQTNTHKPALHTVRPGETIASIAAQYGLTVAQLEHLPGNWTTVIKNGSHDWNKIWVGQRLNVSK